MRHKTFGQIIADAREALGLSQKELAALVRKEDGGTISPQYLNDIEHDRRNPPSEFIIEQCAKHLKLSKEPLIAAAGMWPTDIHQKLCSVDPKVVEQALRQFRQTLCEALVEGKIQRSRDGAPLGRTEANVAVNILRERVEALEAQRCETCRFGVAMSISDVRFDFCEAWMGEIPDEVEGCTAHKFRDQTDGAGK